MELMKIEGQAPNVEFDFEGAKQWLEEELQRYDVQLTEETARQGRELATELNKQAKTLDRARIEKIRELSAPIKAADDQVKELVSMIKQGRQKLLTQLDEFDKEKEAEVQKLLTAERSRLWKEYNVRDEYISAEFDDLIKASSLTPGGKLKKPAKDKLEERVRQDRDRQAQADLRIADLKARSYEAGLDAPLTEDHIKHFLTAPEETYQRELNRIIQAELNRQETARVRERERQEAREQAAQQAEADAAKREVRRRDEISGDTSQPSAPAQSSTVAQTREEWGAPPENDQAPPPSDPGVQASPGDARAQPAPEEAPGHQWEDEDGKVGWECTAVFTTRVSPNITADTIRDALKKKMADAGFENLVRIDVKPDDTPPF